MANSIFLTAQEARQNPLRERVVFDEGTAIGSAIIDSVRAGFFNAKVSGNSPMTQSTGVVSSVVSIDPSTYEFRVPGHSYNTGDAVYVASTNVLAGPLEASKLYYAIYIDADHLKLAASKQDALSRRPISINLVNGVNSITLTDQGAGYTYSPTVVISGGGATVDATAVAYLASYGNISYINVTTEGKGYHYVPSVLIEAQGYGATGGAVYLKVVAASINSAGVNYHVGDELTLTDVSVTAASFRVTSVDQTGAVTSIALVNGGSYTAIPTIISSYTDVTPGGGTGCTLDITLGIAGVDVGLGGSQYTAPPLVKIISNTGTGATAMSYLAAGSVTSIAVLTPGSGYTDIPTIEITSGNGATASAYLDPTGVGDITITFDGNGTYTDPPAVSIDPAGAGAVPGTVTMQINTAILATAGGGSQYVVGDVLVLAGGQGSHSATVVVNTVDSYGSIVTYTLLTSGEYTTLPVMTGNAAYGGTGQGASFNLTAGVKSIAVNANGSNYAAPPAVTIAPTDGNGTGAGAYALLYSGSVTEVVMTAPGTGYTDVPLVTFDNGSGATAEAILVPTTVDVVNVTDAGSGYTQATVHFSGGGGTGAAATAVILGGAIDHVVVTDSGQGYTSTPTASIVGDGVDATVEVVLVGTSIASINITNRGSNYTAVPAVTIDGTATAAASLYSTGVQQIVVIDVGQEYTSVPLVSVIPNINETVDPTPPTTAVVRGYEIATILVTSQGEGYTSVPTVTISAPDQLSGTTATADATIGYGSGSMTIKQYPASRDYWLVSQGFDPIDPNLRRPYAEQIATVTSYFTNLGYTISTQTNTDTGNTMQWIINW